MIIAVHFILLVVLNFTEMSLVLRLWPLFGSASVVKLAIAIFGEHFILFCSTLLAFRVVL